MSDCFWEIQYSEYSIFTFKCLCGVMYFICSIVLITNDIMSASYL